MRRSMWSCLVLYTGRRIVARDDVVAAIISRDLRCYSRTRWTRTFHLLADRTVTVPKVSLTADSQRVPETFDGSIHALRYRISVIMLMLPILLILALFAIRFIQLLNNNIPTWPQLAFFLNQHSPTFNSFLHNRHHKPEPKLMLIPFRLLKIPYNSRICRTPQGNATYRTRKQQIITLHKSIHLVHTPFSRKYLYNSLSTT